MTHHSLASHRLTGSMAALLLLGTLLTSPAAQADGMARHGAPVQYRGPSEEVGSGPASHLPPDLTRTIKAPEGWARWEFWFENEKDTLLRDARERIRSAQRHSSAIRVQVDPPAANAPTAKDIEDRILPALRGALTSGSPEVRGAAAMALGHAADGSSVDSLIRMLQRGIAEDRVAAAASLGSLRSPLATAALADAVALDPSERVRSQAALSLGLIGDPTAVIALKELLERNLAQSSREMRELRTSLLTAMGLTGSRDALPLLDRVLRSRNLRDHRSRAHAARAMGTIADPAAVPSLLRVLSDEDDLVVRRAAALALGSFHDRGAAGGLRVALHGDSDMLVRGHAAVSLARSLGGEAVAELSALTAVRHDRTLRGFAAVSLGLTGGRDALPVLAGLIAGRSEDSVRAAAAVGLGLLGERAAGERLRALAADTAGSADLRGYALLAATMVGDTETEGALREALSGEAPVEIRRAGALGAGVLPFRGSAALLARTLFADEDPTVRGAAILGLGLEPDGSIVSMLVSSIVKNELPHTPGHLASIVALGQMTLRGEPSSVAKIALATEPRSRTDDLSAAVSMF